MPRKRIQITTEPEIKKLKRRGHSVRFRIPAHDGKPESKSKWKKLPDAKTKGMALIGAEEYRRELQDEINDYASRPGISFGEYARNWHDDRKDSGELNGLSFDREELLIRKIEKTSLAGIPLEEVAEEDIDKFKKENAKKESRNEQERLLKKVKQILRFAESRKHIRNDPSRVVKDIKADRKPRRSLTMEQQHQLFNALMEEERDGKHAAILIAMSTGLRRGEILALTWGDYDWRKQTLTVERQLNSQGEIVPPKYGSAGVIPIDGETADYLTRWKHDVRLLAKENRNEVLNKMPICCNESLGFFLPSNFDRWRRRYFVEHGLGTFGNVYTTRDEKGNVRKHYTDFEGFNLHELRHTAASELVGSGADIHTVQTIMRHKRLSTTEQYLHDIDDNLADAVEAVAKKRKEYDPFGNPDKSMRGVKRSKERMKKSREEGEKAGRKANPDNTRKND